MLIKIINVLILFVLAYSCFSLVRNEIKLAAIQKQLNELKIENKGLDVIVKGGGGDGPGFIKIVRHKNEGGVSKYSSNSFSGQGTVTGGVGHSGSSIGDVNIGTLMPHTSAQIEVDHGN